MQEKNKSREMTLDVFAEYIETKRKKLGFDSQDAFADFCKVSQPTISRIEKGVFVDPATYKKIAKALQKDITIILQFPGS